MIFRVNEKGILQIFRFYGKNEVSAFRENQNEDKPNLNIKWIGNEIKNEIKEETIQIIEKLIESNKYENRQYYIQFDKNENRYNIYENLFILQGIEGSIINAFQSLWNEPKTEMNINTLQMLKIKSQGGILFKKINQNMKDTLYEGSITADDGDINCSAREYIGDNSKNYLYLEPSSIRWNIVFHKDLEADNAIKWLNTFRTEVISALLEKIVWEPTLKEKERIWS